MVEWWNATQHKPQWKKRLKLSKFSQNPLVDPTMYRSIVGSLRYLVNTRSDIAYVVGILSRFMEKPISEHMVAIKHLLRYIKGTLNVGCFYVRKKKGEVELINYSDSDMAEDVDDKKGITGVVFFLGLNLITWLSQK